MSYVPGFKNDIFISYAHVDNISVTDDDEGWVTKFHESLWAAIRQKIGRPEGFTIFRDDKLRGNDEFSDTLDAEYRQSAVFISILAPSYLASDWCLKELNGFCAQNHPGFGVKVGDKSRVFKVMPPPHVPPEQHPEHFKGMLGYRFYERNDMTTEEVPFRRTRPDDPDQRYWTRLDALARDIAALLVEMKRLAEGEPQPQPPGVQPTGASVYLAEVTDDLLDYRDQVKRDLEQQGLRVVPDGQLPLTTAEFASAARKELEQSLLSIHLLGQFYGRRPAGEERSFTHLQYLEALKVAKTKKLQRIIWVKKDIDISQLADAKQKTFLESLELEPDQQQMPGTETQVEFVRVCVEELKDIILLKARPPVPKLEGNPFFYISCTPEDNEQARRILGCLREEKYEGVVSPLEDGVDSKMIKRYHRSNLKRCDVFVMLYGRAPEVWVHEKALEAWEVASRRKKKGMTLSVCAWPRPPVRDLGISLQNLHEWNVADEPRCDDVKQFLRQIQNA
jgi:hypothetical protein